MGDKYLYEGRFIHLKQRDGWEYAERPNITGIVLVVPLTSTGELVLNEQYRLPVQQAVIELPAGLVGDTPGEADESLEDAARRELLEETGYAADRLEYLCAGPPSAGITNEILTLYLARDVERVASGGGVEDEQITVHTVPLDEVEAWLEQQVRDGKLVDPKVYAGLYFARFR